MSLAEVQAREAQIISRLTALRGGTPPMGGPIGSAPASFSSTLQAASSAATDGTTSGTAADSTAGSGLGSNAVAVASSQIGTPYVWGGSHPGGFDCSGLVQWTYANLGVTLPRTAAEQAQTGTPVSPADAQPGDLVFFARGGTIDHVGIYAGNGQMVVAPHTGTTVRMESVDLSTAAAIRRESGSVAPTGAWTSALPAQGQQYAGAIAQAAASAGVDPALLSAVAWTESGFDANAQSPAGAQGLMQLMPATASGLGVNALDPTQALAGGARYLRAQLDRFGGRVDLALAAYNAGPTAVLNAGGIPPYPETQNYVSTVMDRMHQLGGTA